MSPEARIFETPADLFRAAATEFAHRATRAVRMKGKFTVALSGGSTPKALYTLLASGSVPNIAWEKIYFFWGDERHVPPEHPDSNYRMVYEALLSKVPVPAQNIFRIHSEEADANVAAAAYEKDLKDFFHLQPGEFPKFDLVLLGVGPDGHTASLFPNTTALQEQARLVVANYVDKFKAYRITLTLLVLNHADCVLFLASGADKTEILRQVLNHPNAGLPSQKVQPSSGCLLWFVDREAAGNSWNFPR